MSIDNIRDRDHAEYYAEEATMTAEVDLMRLGVLIRFEVDVTFYLRSDRYVEITDINEIWAAGVFDHGFEGADYRSGKPRLLNVKVNIDDLSLEEIAEIKADAAIDIAHHLKKLNEGPSSLKDLLW